MSLPELKQAHSLLSRASYILLIVPEHASLDAISSMIALYLTLQATKENGVDEVSPSHVPRNLQFLPGSSQILMSPKEQKELVLDIAGVSSIDSVRSELLNGGLRLHITLPQKTQATKDQTEISVKSMPYDAIVVFGASDLETLGSLYSSHTDFFFNTPIINIDNRASNEHFGTVNLVDITAGSVAEVTYDLIKTLTQEKIDSLTATALYAGVIAGTESFQQPSTSPRSFQTAAHLIELQADREGVIQNLVKTKPLDLLKLSGRLYARLRFDEHIQLFWSLLRPNDFTESGAKSSDIPAAMHELSNNISGFNIAFVLNELAESSYEAYLMLGKGLLQRRHSIKEQLGASSVSNLLHIKIEAPSLEAAEQVVLEKIRSLF